MLALHEAVARVAPIVGITVGDKNNRATWVVQFTDAATPDQIAAASRVIAEFDINATAEMQRAGQIEAMSRRVVS